MAKSSTSFKKGNKASEGLENSGRPALFETAEEMEAKIDEYFESTGWHHNEALNAPEFIHPTVTGLALALGFCDRQSLYDYQDKPEFSCLIKKARTKVEHNYENSLHSKTVTGAIFALKNMGWKDKSEVEQTIKAAPSININLKND